MNRICLFGTSKQFTNTAAVLVRTYYWLLGYGEPPQIWEVAPQALESTDYRIWYSIKITEPGGLTYQTELSQRLSRQVDTLDPYLTDYIEEPVFDRCMSFFKDNDLLNESFDFNRVQKWRVQNCCPFMAKSNYYIGVKNENLHTAALVGPGSRMDREFAKVWFANLRDQATEFSLGGVAR